MIGHKFTSLMLVLCTTIPLMGQSTSTANRLKEFKDVSTGVTYRYPEGWKQVSENQFSLRPAFLQNRAKIRSGVFWAPSGTLKRTNLMGAEFLFALQPRVSAHDCMHPVVPLASSPRVDLVPLNGIKYAHNWAGTGGLCHQMKEDIYATYQNHACYLFDLSVHTICSGAVDGMREASKKELANINAQLISILETMRIDKHATNTPN